MGMVSGQRDYSNITSGPFTPEIEKKTPGADLDAFIKKTPGVNKADVMAHIKEGNDLLKQLKNGETPDPSKTNPKAVVSIMWALTNKAAEKGQLYVSGAMRVQIGDNKADGARVQNFLNACGNENKSSYGRISTHMKENILEGEKQRGIDLKDMGLPAGKQTVLFADQHDGSIYLKMEEHGCPPFWEKGYRNYDNFKEFIGHSTDFITTRFDKPQGAADGASLAKTKEHVPAGIKKEFQAISDLLFPVAKKSFFEKIFSRKSSATDEANKAKAKEFNEGITKGKSNMLNKLENLSDLDLNNNIIAQGRAIALAQTLSNEREKAKDSGYTAGFKGEEVLLTI